MADFRGVQPAEPPHPYTVIEPLGQFPPRVLLELLDDGDAQYLLATHPVGSGSSRHFTGEVLMNQIDNFWVLGDNRINPFEFPVRFDQSGQGSNGLLSTNRIVRF